MRTQWHHLLHFIAPWSVLFIAACAVSYISLLDEISPPPAELRINMPGAQP